MKTLSTGHTTILSRSLSFSLHTHKHTKIRTEKMVNGYLRWDSSVSIVTDYGMDDQDSLNNRDQTDAGSNTAFYPMRAGGPSL
jgi:hypothetical protein